MINKTQKARIVTGRPSALGDFGKTDNQEPSKPFKNG